MKSDKKKTERELAKKKLTATPPAEPMPVPTGAVRRTLHDIMSSTDCLNAAIKRADKGRKTLKDPSPRTFSEKPRACAVLP